MFCIKCGNELPDGSAFCNACGTKMYDGTEKPAESNKFKVVLFRVSQFFVFNPAINVVLDGVENFSLADGQRIEMLLERGKHNIRLSASFRKRNIDFDVNSDMNITVSWNRVTGAIVADVDSV